MLQYLGDFQYGATVYVPFASYDANGASVTLTGLAVTDIEIYKNGSITQRASDAGYTLLDTDGIDFDAITGIHGFSIDTSDNTTAGFFGPGNDYFVVVSSVTISAQTVNFVYSFSIENRHEGGVLLRTTIATLASQTSFTLTAGSVDNSAYVGCVIVISDVASTVQKAVGVISAYTGSTKTVTLLTDPAIFTMAATDYVTIMADRALKATVDNRNLDVSTGGEAGIDWANIGSPTTAQNLSATNIDVDQVVASVSGAVGSVTGAVGSVTGAVGSVTGAVGSVTGAVGSVAAGGITAASIATGAVDADALAADAVAEIADGVWDEDATGHQTQGTFGQAIGDPVADADTIWGLVNTNLDTTVSSRASQTSLDTLDDFVDTEVAAIITTLGTPAGASVSADIAAIEGQTDDIGAAGAGLTAIPWNAAWDAEVESEVDDALVARFLDKLILASGTADSGNTLTMVDAARTEGDADYWKGRLIVFTSGVIAGQCAIITDFNATTDTFTFAPALTQAVATQTYVILPGISVWDDTLAEHLAVGSTGNALNAAGSAGDPWATAIPGAYGAGTAGKIVGDNVNATISSRASQTSLDTLDDFVDTEVAAIITTLGTPAGASVSADIAAIEAQTDDIGAAGAGLTAVPWNAAWDAEVQSEVDDALVAHNLDHLVGTATAIPAIPAGTYIDQMMDDGTAVYDRTTDSLQAIRDKSTDIETKIDTIDNFVDTEVAAIKTVTDALPNAGALTTIQADLDDIQTRLPAALVTGRIDASVGAMAAGVVTAAAIATGAVDADAIAADAVTEIQSGLATAAALDTVDNLLDTEIADIQARLPAALTAGGNIKADALAVNGNTSAAAQLAKSAATIVSGAAIAGTLSTTQMTTDLTEATDDHYNGRIIIWTSGVLINQATDITDYTGATKLFTYTAVTEAPSAGDTFIVV